MVPKTRKSIRRRRNKTVRGGDWNQSNSTNYSQQQNYSQQNYSQQNYSQQNYSKQQNYSQPNYSQQQNYSIVQPNAGLVQPNVGLVQPNVGLVQPNVGLVQPNVINAKPNTGLVQPNAGFVKPNDGQTKPNVSNAKPEKANQKPNAVLAQQLNKAPANKPVLNKSAVVNRNSMKGPSIHETIIYQNPGYGYGYPGAYGYSTYGYPGYGYGYTYPGYSMFGYPTYFGSTFSGLELGLGLGLGAGYLYGQKQTQPIYVNPGIAAGPQVAVQQPLAQQPLAQQQVQKQPLAQKQQVAQQPPPDYYTALGVKRNANVNSIKKSYTALKNAIAKQPTKPGINTLKTSVNAAYDTLTNVTKRKAYNTQVDDWVKTHIPSKQ